MGCAADAFGVTPDKQTHQALCFDSLIQAGFLSDVSRVAGSLWILGQRQFKVIIPYFNGPACAYRMAFRMWDYWGALCRVRGRTQSRWTPSSSGNSGILLFYTHCISSPAPGESFSIFLPVQWSSWLVLPLTGHQFRTGLMLPLWGLQNILKWDFWCPKPP